MKSKQKLCVIFSHPSFYRQFIYKKIDDFYQCDWHFSTEDGGVKRFDPSIFKSSTIHKFHKFGRFQWMSGINSLLSKKENTTFLMLAGTVDLSCWLFFIRKRLFYPKKKLYLWGHGWYGKESPLEARIKKLLFACADGICVYGNWAKNLMVAQGIPAEKIDVIYNSLNYEAQYQLRNTNLRSSIYADHFHNNYPNIVVIGRLNHRKKLGLLFEALNLLKDKGVSLNVTLVGDGEAYNSLQERASQLELKDSVWFYGSCYSEEMNAELMYNADLCVTPGDIGLTAIHALMFGVPVITHDDFIHQGPEFEAIVPNVTGQYFQHDNANSLSNVIFDWITQHTDRESVRLDCYKEVDSKWNPDYQIKIITNFISN